MENYSDTSTVKSIDMYCYGLDLIVITTQDQIDWTVQEIKNKSKKIFGWKGSKKELLNYLESVLLEEDQYFNSTMEVVDSDHQRWADFMNDCVIYSCLHSHLNGMDVPAKDFLGIEHVIEVMHSYFDMESQNDNQYIKNGTIY
jgi:hypothetical protein